MKTRLGVTMFLSSAIVLVLFGLLNLPIPKVVAEGNIHPLIVIGDTQICQHTIPGFEGYTRTIQHINERAQKEEIAAIVTTGDNVHPEFPEFFCHHTTTITDYQMAWDDYLLALKPARVKLNDARIYYVPGNHDKLNSPEGMAAWNNAMSVTHQPNNAIDSNGDVITGAGSFDVESMHVAYLRIDSHTTSQLHKLQDQLNWLTNDLSNTIQHWKIVVFHFPSWGADGTPNGVYAASGCVPTHTWHRADQHDRIHQIECNFEWQIPNDLKEDLHEIFKAYGVRLVVTGHRHAYYAYVKDGIHYVTAPTASDGFEVSALAPGETLAYTQAVTTTVGQVGTTAAAIARNGYLEILPSPINTQTKPITLTVTARDENGNVLTDTTPITIYYPPVTGIDAAVERSDPEIVDFFVKGYRYEYRNAERAFYVRPLCAIWGGKANHPPLTGINAAFQNATTRYFYADGYRYNQVTTSSFAITTLQHIWGLKTNHPPTTGIQAAFYSYENGYPYFYATDSGISYRYNLTPGQTIFNKIALSYLWRNHATRPRTDIPIDATWRKYDTTYFYQEGTRWTLTNSQFISQPLTDTWANLPVIPDSPCLIDPSQCTGCP